jgi:hypothetical protein
MKEIELKIKEFKDAYENSKQDIERTVIKEQLKVYANEYDTSKQRPEDLDKGEGQVLLARGTDPQGREAGE